jgi:ABC-type xylose transport system permease subunit
LKPSASDLPTINLKLKRQRRSLVARKASARLSAVPITRVKAAVFAIRGLLAALAAHHSRGLNRLNQAAPTTAPDISSTPLRPS